MMHNKAASIGDVGSSSLMIATFIHDEVVVQDGDASVCSPGERRECPDAFSPLNQTACLCFSVEEYFVQNPEEQIIIFNHGFRIDQPLLSRVGTSWGSFVEMDEKGGIVSTRTGELVTKIHKTDGSLCVVGGFSEWRSSDATHGISGTLREWLACAGLTLDSDPRDLLPVEGMPHSLRNMGFAIELEIKYVRQKLGADVVICHLTVLVTPILTSLVNTDFLELSGHGSNRTALRTRTMYGAQVTLKVSGEFTTFDSMTCLNFMVDCIVLLQLPFYIVQFIALYCLGFISEIYRNAKKSHFNVQQQVFGQIARLMLAGSGFEAMAAADGDGDHLSEQDIRQRLEDCFSAEIESGILTEQETRRMAEATFQALNVDGADYIGLSEFLRAFTVDNSISVEHAAKFFDQDAKLGRLQRLVDCSVSDRESIFRQQQQGESLDTQANMQLDMQTDVQADAQAAGKDAKPKAEIILDAASRETTWTGSLTPQEMSLGSLPDLERRISSLEAQIRRCDAQNGNWQTVTLQTCNCSRGKKAEEISTASHSAAAQSSSDPSTLPCGGTHDPRILGLEQRADQIEDLLLSMEMSMTDLKDSHKRVPNLLKKTQHLDDGLGILQSRLDQHMLEEEATIASIKRDCELVGQRVERWMRILIGKAAQTCDSEISESMQSSLDQLFSEPALFSKAPGDATPCERDAPPCERSATPRERDTTPRSRNATPRERDDILKGMEDAAVSHSILVQEHLCEPPLDGIPMDTEERPVIVHPTPSDAGHNMKPSRGNANYLSTLNQVWMWEPFAEGRRAQSSGHLAESVSSRPLFQQRFWPTSSHDGASKDSGSSLDTGQGRVPTHLVGM